ncbi:sugar phosphate nucleotidyltransferase [Paenibacillus herberti]|uniref:Mannose-1-phosphate guanylyltransferase n=1 Tax=Paenibacillus herberti TaxID=1619309 RepID=A0A229NXH5_9BACL|nr:sugar phosphate nucleotidyltransferase [Paenibacillus herberti]OXM14329.1 mannose-1-phosphate guanylyltransferase [Paenibacillus herberti]
MRIILLSGGSGKRLWPLSNDIRSKLFLKLLPAPDGGLESMMQRLCRQLREAGLLQGAIIVTHRSQAEITRVHAGPDIPIIEEPHKRGTFTAAALGAAYLAARGGASLDEPVCVLPVDLFVQQDFFDLLRHLPEAVLKGAELAMIGTEPSHPSTQYGYIVPKRKHRRGDELLSSADETSGLSEMASNGEQNSWQLVERFAEKPDPPLANQLMKQGALWNCGIFSFRLSWLQEKLRAKGYPVRMEELQQGYTEWAEKSFDKELAEQAERRMVMRYRGSWQDLGSWSTFLGQLGHAQLGPGSVSAGTINTHLINELGSPIHIIGISDAVVAASPDGILVASKEQADRIKESLSVVPSLPMQEEKRWGSCRTLDVDRLESGDEVLTRRVVLKSGKCTSYHLHTGKEEVWTVLGGVGRFMLEDQIYNVGPGDVMRFPPGSRHGVKAITELHCVQVEIGRVHDERDIERLLMSW